MLRSEPARSPVSPLRLLDGLPQFLRLLREDAPDLVGSGEFGLSVGLRQGRVRSLGEVPIGNS